MMTWCFFSTQMAQLVARAVPIFRCEVFASILVLTFPPSGLGSRSTLIGAQGPLTPTCQQINGWNNFRQCISSLSYVPEGVQFPLTMGQSASPSQYRRCLCLWPSMEHHVHCAHWNSWLLTSRTSESNDWLIIQGLHFWLRTGRSKIVGQRQQSNDTTNEDRTNSENHDSPKAWIPKGGFGMSILIHWSTLILMLLTLLIQNIICVLELDLANVGHPDGFRWQSLPPEIRGLGGGLFHVESLKHEWDNQDFWNSKHKTLFVSLKHSYHMANNSFTDRHLFNANVGFQPRPKDGMGSALVLAPGTRQCLQVWSNCCAIQVLEDYHHSHWGLARTRRCRWSKNEGILKSSFFGFWTLVLQREPHPRNRT